MKIIFKEENGKLFGSTDIIGVGKKQPKLIYGEQAKKLRENANLTVEQLANEFSVRPNIITKIEKQQMALEPKMCNKYTDKFNVTKEYFFDLELETLILSGEGHIIKSFNSSDECKKAYDDIMKRYFNALNNGENYILVDFTKERGN